MALNMVMGRLTAFELQSMQAPHVMICDTMVGSLFQHHTIHAVGAFRHHCSDHNGFLLTCFQLWVLTG